MTAKREPITDKEQRAAVRDLRKQRRIIDNSEQSGRRAKRTSAETRAPA